MKKLLPVAAAAALCALTATSAFAGPANRTTICHATGSTSNPFVLIAPANPSLARGHRGDAVKTSGVAPGTRFGPVSADACSAPSDDGGVPSF